MIFYGVYDYTQLGTSGFVIGLFTQYSDDDGATWSSPVQHASSVDSGYTAAVDGSMIEIGGGLLMKNYYAWASSGSGPYVEWVTFSSDNGATWGGDVEVVTSTTIQWDESSYVYLGGDTIVGMSRWSNGTTFRQTISTDNGQTWTDLGATSFDSWSTPSPPTLVNYTNAAGVPSVACYWLNRTTGELNVTTCTAASLIADGTAAWAALTTIWYGFGLNAGYVSVVQYGPHGFGWLYYGVSSSVSRIAFFDAFLP